MTRYISFEFPVSPPNSSGKTWKNAYHYVPSLTPLTVFPRDVGQTCHTWWDTSSRHLYCPPVYLNEPPGNIRRMPSVKLLPTCSEPPAVWGQRANSPALTHTQTPNSTYCLKRHTVLSELTLRPFRRSLTTLSAGRVKSVYDWTSLDALHLDL